MAALNSAPVQEAFKKQMIKPVPNASIADAKAWSDKELAHWKHLAETVKVEKPDGPSLRSGPGMTAPLS